MKLRLLTLAALVCASVQVSAQAPDAPASARALNIAFDITNNGEKIGSPRLTGMAGETFSIEIGSKYRYDPSSTDKTGQMSINRGSIGTRIKCTPALQAGDAVLLDCNFRTTEVDGESTTTKHMQAKLLLNMGKPTSLRFDDKGRIDNTTGTQGLGISVLADWAKAS